MMIAPQSQQEASALLGATGFGPVDIPGRLSRWCPQAACTGRTSLVAALDQAAEAAWTTDRGTV
jgi:hypothetical protein